jgi:hypothetical protein
MSKRTDAMKRKAEKNLARAKVAAKRYRVAHKNS